MNPFERQIMEQIYTQLKYSVGLDIPESVLLKTK